MSDDQATPVDRRSRLHAIQEREHLDRFLAMLEDDGETWDLSDNDKAAIRWLLQERQVLTGVVADLEAQRTQMEAQHRADIQMQVAMRQAVCDQMKEEIQKANAQRTKEQQAFSFALREYRAFGHLSGETLTQLDELLAASRPPAQKEPQ